MMIIIVMMMVKLAMVIMVKMVMAFLMMMVIFFWLCEALSSLGEKSEKIQLKLWWDDYDVMITIMMIMMTTMMIMIILMLILFCFFFVFFFVFFWTLWWLGEKNQENSIKIIMASTLPVKGRALITVQYYIGSAETLNKKNIWNCC